MPKAVALLVEGNGFFMLETPSRLLSSSVPI